MPSLSLTLDTKAIALMALKCVQGVRRSETLNRHIREGLEALGALQRLDGSFGNTHTTALAIQVCHTHEKKSLVFIPASLE